MLSALLRPFQGSSSHSEDRDRVDAQQDPTPRPSVAEYRRHLHATADFTEADDDDDDDDSHDGAEPRFPLGGGPQEDEDGLAQTSGLLPLFSATNLDLLPVYSVTHAIRVLVQARTETTLTWDQLRSPQVSQFLVKPMQQQIRTQHFSPGTLYALMANCLQFEKEVQLHPGNAGTSATRARVCELLAIKLLKEYTTRELVDALCYDFYPLQGIPGSQSPLSPEAASSKPAALRSSTLEVAIRASAKQFLSHPLVVRQLEAIWNGAISFYPGPQESQLQGSASSIAASSRSRRQANVRTPLLGDQQAKEDPARSRSLPSGRRSVALYDPRTASLFKLSRLRVPRYRRILSTCSLVVLICLFLAVLSQRSSTITTLELLFWFWSAGFMLDEVVGFNEQGLSFYIMSFWSIFDLATLLLLMVYYCMRIYGVFLVDPHQSKENAYDILALSAVLLLPRIFGVLDHYRYFSQLLIAFRLLAIDLAAVFLLILISCSGFFVFFVFSRNPDDPSALAYKTFQVLAGFTPAAWEMWSSYNWAGKALLGLFLIICQFMVITMLVTVLANSFMSVASRANEEYQFLFAINTISMVKNDALFSYIAPGNIFAWSLMPLRYCMPLKQYIQLNRAVIKVTHFPLLFCIYFYEKYFLALDVYEATDLIDKPHRGRQHVYPFADPVSRSVFFSPGIRAREESVFGYQKDRMLEEVFRYPPDMRAQRRSERRKTQNAIRTWMDQQGKGLTAPQNYSTINSRATSDWQRRLSMNRERPSRFPRNYSDIRSAASDPADFVSDAAHPAAPETYQDNAAPADYATEVKDVTDGDADGDDELVTNDEDEEDNVTNNMGDGRLPGGDAVAGDYFETPVATRFTSTDLSSAGSPGPSTSRQVSLHTRTLSTDTILYAPEDPHRPHNASSRPMNSRQTPVTSPVIRGDERRSPRRSLYMASRPRLMLQTSGSHIARTAPNRPALALDIPSATSSTSTKKAATATARRRSLADIDLGESLDSTLPSPAGGGSGSGGGGGRVSNSSSNSNRLVMARMKSLEESLGDVVREMRILRMSVPSCSSAHNSDEMGGGARMDAAAWARQQRRSFVFAESDLSSGSGDGGDQPGPVIEVAGARDRERGERSAGGSMRRSRTMPRRPTGGSFGRKSGGVWRSLREGSSGSGGVVGLGIGRIAKGKEKERERVVHARQDWNGDGAAAGFGRDGDYHALSSDTGAERAGGFSSKGSSF